ncbi:hypothetical protein Lal_00015464 [Lupinus albus]|jgi:recombination protein RecA|nr:hypothetical protein Lal_00015464 [Lupinus albus]MBN9395532.1 recombinase RecA [Candidatus Melainabacteria bacterium]MBX9673419.1 recombinase RecA [Candidatus Obscuribacterales bacterium]
MATVTKEKANVDKQEKSTEKASGKHADKADKSGAAAPSERLKALGMALDAIKKQYGDGSIMKLGESKHSQIEVVPTGALSLDVALGVGGLPRGRIIEVYGPESSGKTTLAQHVAAEVQKMGGIAAIVDAEHAMDPEYARALGVNVDELLISQPDTGEQALEITEQLVRSGAVDVVIVDSVAALVPKAEIEGEMGDSLPGLQARLMSQALRKLTGIVAKTHTMVIFINQLRQKIGVMYGNPETTTGGNALKFYASIRLDIRKIETLKKDGVEIGNRVKVKVVKNKVAPPFRIAEFDIIYGRGINSAGCLLDIAAEMDIVKKSGTWFSYKEERIGQGRDQARNYLESHPEMLKEIESRVKAQLSGKAEA